MTAFWSATGFGTPGVYAPSDSTMHYVNEEAYYSAGSANLSLFLLTVSATSTLGAFWFSGQGMGAREGVLALAVDDVMPPFPDPLLALADAAGGYVFMYEAFDETELASRYAVCKAAIVDWINAMPSAHSYYLDHQVVGSAHGGFTGIFFMWRGTAQPTIPSPP